MEQLGHVERVVGETRHQLSRFLLIVKAKGQFLQMLKKLATHVALHLRSHHVTLIVNE